MGSAKKKYAKNSSSIFSIKTLVVTFAFAVGFALALGILLHEPKRKDGKMSVPIQPPPKHVESSKLYQVAEADSSEGEKEKARTSSSDWLQKLSQEASSARSQPREPAQRSRPSLPSENESAAVLTDEASKKISPEASTLGQDDPLESKTSPSATQSLSWLQKLYQDGLGAPSQSPLLEKEQELPGLQLSTNTNTNTNRKDWGSESSLAPNERTSQFIRKHRTQKLDSYLARREEQCEAQGKWVTVDMAEENILYTNFYSTSQNERGAQREERQLTLTTCEIEDEDGQGGWFVNRLGPFIGVGGYDSHSVTVLPLPHPQKAKFITGKLSAPVNEYGDVLNYPPAHTHHLMVGFSGVYHAIESHGDAVCSEEYGGEACYLISYPDGYGLPIANETDNKDWFGLVFVLNDVRAYPSPPMEFYGEIAFKWSSRDSVKPIAAAALQMQGIDHEFQANVVSQRPSIRWGTAKWVEDGKVIISPEDQLPWFHSHRSYFKSMWAFAASAEELGLTADLLHPVDDYDQGALDKYDLVWTPDGEDATQALMNRIQNSSAGMDALRCWLIGSEEEKILEHVNATTDSSALYPEPWQQNWKESWYDRAGEVHCDPWSFKKGDNYTIVTLNGVDDRLSDKLDSFTMMQHAILFIAYEGTGGSEEEAPPTMEVYGSFCSGEDMGLKLKSTFLPEYLQKRKDYYKRNITDLEMNLYYGQELDVQGMDVMRMSLEELVDHTMEGNHAFFDEARRQLDEKGVAAEDVKASG